MVLRVVFCFFFVIYIQKLTYVEQKPKLPFVFYTIDSFPGPCHHLPFPLAPFSHQEVFVFVHTGNVREKGEFLDNLRRNPPPGPRKGPEMLFVATKVPPF